MEQPTNVFVGRRILVIDDEPDFVRVVQRNLTRFGAHVTVALRFRDAFTALDQANMWDVVVVDQILPDGDGLVIVDRIAGLQAKPAVIAVSGNLQSPKRSLRLQALGAVLLPKPFGIEDLSSAMSYALSERTTVKTATPPTNDTSLQQLRYKSIVLDLVTQTATVDGSTVELQPAQLRILAHLLTHPGRRFGAAELTESVLRGTHERGGSNIRFQIHALRRRLGTAANLIETCDRGYGVGLGC